MRKLEFVAWALGPFAAMLAAGLAVSLFIR